MLKNPVKTSGKAPGIKVVPKLREKQTTAGSVRNILHSFILIPAILVEREGYKHSRFCWGHAISVECTVAHSK